METEKHIEMVGVQSSDIDFVWDKVVPLIERAIYYSYGKWESEDVYHAIKNKDMQLWLILDGINIKACIVTQILVYPKDKILMIVFASGSECHEWVYTINEFREYAKEHGCSSVEFYGRDGWWKKMKHLGIKKVYSVYKIDT
jgi:hypothetical protein